MTHASPAASVPLIEAVANNFTESRQLLCAKFERGLRYLINRICPAYVEECFRATIDEATSAIRTGRVLTEDDLRSCLRETARRIAGTFPPAPFVNKVPAIDPQVISAIRQNLNICTPVQREALFDYYVREESPASICEALGLDIEQFNRIRKAAKGVLGLRFNELTHHEPLGKKSAARHRGATFLFKVEWRMSVGGGTTS